MQGKYIVIKDYIFIIESYTKYRDGKLQSYIHTVTRIYKNSSGDEIANVNFYAVRPEATRIGLNNAK